MNIKVVKKLIPGHTYTFHASWAPLTFELIRENSGNYEVADDSFRTGFIDKILVSLVTERTHLHFKHFI